MKIFVDTREKKMLWDPKTTEIAEFCKLDEGDYTIENLYNRVHAERKSPGDLYGSIIQGHSRFRKELQRAIDKKIVLAVFVECPRETFISKKFDGGWRLRTQASTLRKIVGTIESKYSVQFVWCEDRDAMRVQMMLWFRRQEELLGV